MSAKNSSIPISPIRAPKHKALLSEKFAIVVCGLLVGVFAIPLLVVIQTLSAIVWGTTTVFRLLEGEGLFDEEIGS